MRVLQEILAWSKGQPKWQQEALRRLVLNGNLSSDDIGALTEICKSAHGLAESPEIEPLAEEDIPEDSGGSAPVSLESIFHQRGVNALAEEQTLKFGQNLTVVYGNNAAGKSGYTRILKNACRARGREEILGNVVLDTPPPTPEFSIKYKVGSKNDLREWSGNDKDEFLSQVSVFDTQCAAIYLTERTDVAFRPFGLDLFDKLVKACKAVKEQLEHEQHKLHSNTLTLIQRQIPYGTGAAKLLNNITQSTKTEDVHKLTQLSVEEEAGLGLLEKSLLDLRANDPEKLIRNLGLHADRVKTLGEHIKTVEESLSANATQEVFDLRSKYRRICKAAEKPRKSALSLNTLDGTGEESWASLWEAARKFSEESAYPGKSYPFVEDEAQCVLCQQKLDQASRLRLQQFESFVTSSDEDKLQGARENLTKRCEFFDNLNVLPEAVDETLKEVLIENKPIADDIRDALRIAECRRKAICQALKEDQELASDCPDVQSVIEKVDNLEGEIAKRLDTLHKGTDDGALEKMTTEAEELRARKLLAQHEKDILYEIDRKKKYAAYNSCIANTETALITRRNTRITERVVTDKLKQEFQDELDRLGFGDVKVELQGAGGTEGTLYNRIVLTKAEDTELLKVLSEGEQRCLSIAAFFAELSTADDPSGIVFDDPISSLDHEWRDKVAYRLVEEAEKRQVIVFTHDIVFLLRLKQRAREKDVISIDLHIEKSSTGAGVCMEELPWLAMGTRDKIKCLEENELQATIRLFENTGSPGYEEKVGRFYGLLRGVWERAVEEILLNGVVERYRPSVETRRISKIIDICDEDYRTLSRAMTKCSGLLTGHDQAAAADVPTPEPEELKADIKELKDWVREINHRRRQR